MSPSVCVGTWQLSAAVAKLGAKLLRGPDLPSAATLRALKHVYASMLPEAGDQGSQPCSSGRLDPGGIQAGAEQLLQALADNPGEAASLVRKRSGATSASAFAL